MRGNFSRFAFDSAVGATGLHYQQGQLTLDSDFNLQQAIQLHQHRLLAEHLIGPFGGVQDSFRIKPVTGLLWDVAISPGNYYVQGHHCRNGEQVTWRGEQGHRRQPWLEAQPQPKHGTYLAFLELWERHVDPAEMDGLREVALGGPATVALRQRVWKVRLREWPRGPNNAAPQISESAALAVLRGWSPAGRGAMAARARRPAPASDPCVVSPRASYSGIENRLYRIEIYRGGTVGGAAGQTGPTFIWSGDNGSIVLPVESVGGTVVRLAASWLDARSEIAVGDHVEISDESIRMNPGAGPIRKVTGYDPDESTLTLDSPPGPAIEAAGRGLLLRRWDHKKGDPNSGHAPLADDRGLQLVEDQWLAIEDGIAIRFEPGTPGHVYRSGDYWLIPARTGLADIVWPNEDDPDRTPRALPPDGVELLQAPLAAVTFAGDGTCAVTDLRRVIRQSATVVRASIPTA
ncbi:MAG TPA: DUF6519 domain-containing protein [Allosphingosinicella sp.]|jgi:hypothetical protein